MAYNAVEAIPLISQDGDREDEVFALKSDAQYHERAEKHTGVTRSLPTILLTSAFLVSLISLLYNAYLFSSALRTTNVLAAPKRIAVENLRRPSLYLGLERVPGYRGARHVPGAASSAVPASPGHVPIFHPGTPTEMARVSSKFPDVVFAQDGWVFLTEDDRMLLQFDAPQAVEGTQCTFLGMFPQRRNLGLLSPAQQLTLERDDGQSSAPEIQLFALPGLVDLSSVTWETRPAPAGTALGTLSAAFGTNATTAAFDCPQSPLLVEVACVGGGCRVEYTYPDLSTTNGPSGKQTKAVPVGIMLVVEP